MTGPLEESAQVAEWVAAQLETAPPLTDAQVERVASILAGASRRMAVVAHNESDPRHAVEALTGAEDLGRVDSSVADGGVA